MAAVSSRPAPTGRPRSGTRRRGALVSTLGEHPFELNAVAYSPDGRWIATASGLRFPRGGYGPEFEPPGQVAVWDAATGQVAWRRAEPDGAVLGVAFAPDVTRIAWGSYSILNFSDPSTGAILGRHPISAGGRPCSFSNDGRWIGVAGIGTGMMWDTSLNRAVHQFGKWKLTQNPYGWVSEIAFQPPGRDYVAMVFGYLPPDFPETSRFRVRENVTHIVDARRNLPIYALGVHEDTVRDCQFRPRDGKPPGDRRAGRCDCDLGAVPGQGPGVGAVVSVGIRGVVIRPDGGQLAAAGEDGIVRVDGLDAGGHASTSRATITP